MDGRRCFIRMGGWTTLFYKDGWTTTLFYGRTTLFYKDVDGRRCFIRMGGWTDDVVL